jgi:RNA polymerase sigma-70 factor (ECF subfamily)
MRRVVILTVLLTGPAVRADDISVVTARPVVVKTIPEAGTSEVDPKLTEIKVTFSKDMLDASWSWVQLSKESFPNLDGKPKYLKDKRTCVLPVKLEPGHTYALWINDDRFDNFKDADGRSAVPYLLVFRTKGTAKTGGGSAREAIAFGHAFDALWEDMDRHYSYFDLKKVDWKALRQRYRTRAVAASGVAEFVDVLRDMLAPLHDGHVWIEGPGDRQVGTFRPPARPVNYNRKAVLATLEAATPCGDFAVVGTVKGDGFGAIVLTHQSAADEATVRRVVEFVHQKKDAPGFVVDLREANGGNELLARRIAREFCGKDTVYARGKFRSGSGHGEFGPANDRLLRKSDKAFVKPVVCLIGPRCVSSGEGFAQMLKCLPHVTMVGQRTRGSSGNPRPFRLPGTDVTVWYSRWVDLMPDGTPIEGAGVAPDVEVNASAQDYAEKDPTWEKALAVLRDKAAKFRK